MKSLLPALAVLLAPFALSAQVVFQQFPKPLQLYPRDLVSNKAIIVVSGTAAASPDSLIFTLKKSDGSLQRQAISPNDLINSQFNLQFELEAGLWSYHFTAAQVIGNTPQLLREADNLVAGDIYAVEGQSNAQAVAYNGDANIWQNNYIRSFGTPNPDIFVDQNWYIAEGNGYFSPGAVGQWALRMGYLLQENLKVPIAIINGADPGKPIEFFQRNDAQPYDSTTNYGRLLQRLENAGVREHVRAMIYYQGESDGDRATTHKTLFEALHADWESDLSPIEAYYVIQVREGCGGPTLQLRDYQRAFEDYLPKTKAMTANGINGHDGCHYDVQGYKTLGEKLYKQISADLYQTPTGEQINIRVLSASFTNDLNTQIRIVTDATSGLIAQTGSANDFKLHGASASVIGVQADGNNLLLELDQSVNVAGTGLSYGGHAGSEAWILNANGYGLFTFYNLLIDNYTVLPNFELPGIMSGSGNAISLDGVDDYVYVGPILKPSYTKEAWINWQGGSQLNNIVSGIANTAFWAPNGQLAAGHNGAWFQVVDNEVLIPNQWTHVAVSYDAILQELRLYKNGKLVSQAQTIPDHNDPEVLIGSFGGCCTFQGKIDEVRIWDTVRTIEEIRANMCQKFPGTAPGLSAYFRMDETAGSTAPNVTAALDGQLRNFQGLGLNEAWKRSGAPIGTKSTYTYKPVDQLELAIASGDHLTLSSPDIPDFVHLYFVEEVPNILQPAGGYVLVDNDRYFGLFYANQSITQYDLTYNYEGNPFATVQESKLGLLQRRNNAQTYWLENQGFSNNPAENSIQTSGSLYQEYILAIKDTLPLSPMSAQLSVVQPVLCYGLNNGTLNVMASGGQTPYTYSLNGGIPQSSSFFTGLSDGTYSVLVMDQIGNSIMSNQVDLQSPAPLVASVQIQENNVTLNITGGVSPYTISSDAPDPNLQNLPNGVYSLEVSDANGCLFNTLFSIAYVAFTSSTAWQDEDPCDGTADLVIQTQGGATPYQYSLNQGPLQVSNTFSDLTPGVYSVTVFDNMGRTLVLSPIELYVPEVLTATISVNNQSAQVSVIGGLPPYNFSLDGAAPQPDSIFNDVTSGPHSIEVKDFGGCITTLNFSIQTSAAGMIEDEFGIFHISPNPSTGLFELRGNTGTEEVHIAIFDFSGRRLKTLDFQPEDQQILAKIELSDQANGLYLLQIRAGDKVQNIPLVKMK